MLAEHVFFLQFVTENGEVQLENTLYELVRYRCKRVIVHITFHHKP